MSSPGGWKTEKKGCILCPHRAEETEGQTQPFVGLTNLVHEDTVLMIQSLLKGSP